MTNHESCFDCLLDFDDEGNGPVYETFLASEGIESAEKLLALRTLTGAERNDLEQALNQEPISPDRMKEIWQNHISELL